MSEFFSIFKKQAILNQMAESLKAGDSTAGNNPLYHDFVSADQIFAGFEKLHELLYPVLSGYVKLLLRAEKEVEDLLHELFIAAWHDQCLISNTPDLKLYFFKIAREHGIASLKKTRFSDLEYLLFDQPVINFNAEDFDCAAILADRLLILNNLPPLAREIIYLQLCCGFDAYEISLLTGKTYESILTSASQARDYMKLNLMNGNS